MDERSAVPTERLPSDADGDSNESRRERELQARLAEKEILLREVHHRVKNDMAVIVSFLSLQAGELSADNPGRLVLQEARSRVEGMVRLYDLLARSNDFRTIAAGLYIQDLVLYLHGLSPDPARISVRADCEEISMDARLLFPLGMAVNELVTNAIKHAFPDGRAGTVRVTLRREPPGGVLAEVRDDGVGLPSDDSLRTGLGLSLVPALTSQVGGALERTSSPEGGTVFSIRIP